MNAYRRGKMDVRAKLVGPKCAEILPSPPESPESPSMYACPSASGEHGRRLGSRQVLPTSPDSPNVVPRESIRQAGDDKATTSQAQESCAGQRWTPIHSSNLHQVATIQNSLSACSDKTSPDLPLPEQIPDHGQVEDHLKQEPSPASSISSDPPSQSSTEEEHQSGGDEMLTGSDDEDAEADQTVPEKSSAERLAEKRKMKRFRLTHAQTRYLTSEFSRQPHPDAAQRERLSRDIPGLNPRQVQVWFQNRRAKLKRLTTDDQDRMRRSRTLPEDFNFSPLLQRSLREARPFYSSALTEPLMLGGSSSPKPSLRLGMDHVNPLFTGMSSSFANHIPSPISAAGSILPSPVSPVNDGSRVLDPRFSSTQSPYVTGPQFTNPFSGSNNLSAGFPGYSRQGRPCSQNGAMGSIASASSLSSANNSYGYGCLPPLKFAGSSYHTRDDEHFGRLHSGEGNTLRDDTEATHHYVPTSCSPTTLSYEQAHMLHPSNSGLRTSSYYQVSETESWRGDHLRTQDGYQCGQPMQPPHQTTEHRHGNSSSGCPLPPDARHDHRSFSLGGERYCGVSSPVNDDPAAPSHNLKVMTTARPRARSDTFPAYHGDAESMDE